MKIIDEIAPVLQKIPAEHYEKLATEILAAERIFVSGAGRSGLLSRTFAMRLFHLGIRTFVTGETITPAISRNDLLVSCSGTGETATTRHFAEVARNVGAKICLVTAQPNSTLAGMADILVPLPAERSEQISNSLYEQILFLFLEQTVEVLRGKIRQQPDLKKIHANLQ